MADESSPAARFDATLYEGAIAEKHHYDNLSWTIGGVALLGAGLLVATITQVEGASYLHRLPARVTLAALANLFLVAWLRIYQRNRFWAEVANEKLRDLERARGIEGVTLAFMLAALAGQVTLKNVALDGSSAAPPFIEHSRARSMHLNVRTALLLGMVLTWVLAFLP